MPSNDNPKRSQTKDKTFATVGSGIFSCLRGGVGLLPPLDIGNSTFLRNIFRPALESYVDVEDPERRKGQHHSFPRAWYCCYTLGCCSSISFQKVLYTLNCQLKPKKGITSAALSAIGPPSRQKLTSFPDVHRQSFINQSTGRLNTPKFSSQKNESLDSNAICASYPSQAPSI